jgi:hypothetical protein
MKNKPPDKLKTSIKAENAKAVAVAIPLSNPEAVKNLIIIRSLVPAPEGVSGIEPAALARVVERI